MCDLRDRERRQYETLGFESPGFWDCRRDSRFPDEGWRDGRRREALGPAMELLAIDREGGPWVLSQFSDRGLRPRQGMLVCPLPPPAQRNCFKEGDLILIGREPEATMIQLFPELGKPTRDTTANEICGMSIGFTGRKQDRYDYGYMIERIQPSDEVTGGGYVSLRGVVIFLDEEKRGAATWEPGLDAVLLEHSTQWTREQAAVAAQTLGSEPGALTILFGEFIGTFAPGADPSADQSKGSDPLAKADLGQPARLWVYLPGTRALGLRLAIAVEKFISGGLQGILLNYVEAFAADLVEKNVLENVKRKGKVEQGDWLGSARKADEGAAKKFLDDLAGGPSGRKALPGQDALMELYANRESLTADCIARITFLLTENILQSILPFGDKISSLVSRVVKEVLGKGDAAKTIGDKLGGELAGQLDRIPRLLLDALGGISTQPRF